MNAAEVPKPFLKPANDPAIVVTAAVGLTRRTLPDWKSLTSTLCPNITRPTGLLSAATTPTPSVEAAAPLPATVETAPPGLTARSLLFDVSATYSVPVAPS